jgi:hypothetical protein
MASVMDTLHATVQHLLDAQQLQAQLQRRLTACSSPVHEELLGLCLDVAQQAGCAACMQRVP